MGASTLDGGANVSIRGVSFQNDVVCGSTTGPRSAFALHQGSTHGNLIGQNCTMVIDRSHLVATTGGSATILTFGPPEVFSLLLTNAISEGSIGFSFSTMALRTAVRASFNTFYYINGGTQPCSTVPQGITFDDNIFYTTPPSGDVVQGTGCTLDTNIMFPQTMNLGANTRRVDPVFVDSMNGNFHLRVGSPAIAHGKPAPGTFDFDGVARPAGASDMGALQYKP